MGFLKRRFSKTKNNVTDAMELGIFTSVFGMVKDIFLTIFMPWKRERGLAESYDEAIARMKLTPQDIEERKKMFTQQTIIYISAALAVVAYGVYLAFQQAVLSMAVAFMVGGLSLSYAFRSHFWLYQLKQKKLGCTFKEYLDSSLKG